MSIVIRFLTLILCFELIVQPLNLSLLSSPTVLAQSTTCAAGQEWNADAGRCLSTATTQANTQSQNECLNSTNSDADYNKCLQDKVKAKANELGKTKSDDFGANLVGGFGGEKVGGMAVVSASMIAVPLFFVGASLGNSQSKITDCTPASLMFMYAGAAAFIGGEIYSFIAHKENLKKMNDRLTELTKANTESVGGEARVAQGTEVQKGSIELLAENEASLAEVARNKAIFYGVSTGLFAAGLVAAIIESVQLGSAKAQLTQGQAMMAVPQTAAQGQQLVQTSRQTIKSLTCREPAGQKGEKKEVASETASEAATPPSTGGNNAQNGGSSGGGNLLDTGSKLLGAGQQVGSMIGGGGNNQPSGSGATTPPTTTPTTPPPASDPNSSDAEAHRLWVECQKTGIDPNSAACKAHKQFLDDQNDAQSTPTPIPDAGIYNSPGGAFYEPLENPLKNFAFQKVAIHNLTQARNNYELMELMNELRSIDQEARSSASFFNENTEFLAEDLKQQTFGQEVASMIVSALGIPSAHAQRKVQIGDEARALNAQRDAELNKSVAENEKQASAAAANSIAEPLNVFKDKNPAQAKAAEKTANDTAAEWIYQPQTRAVGNGILGAWTGVYTGFLIDQTIKSEARAKALKEAAGQFTGGTGVGQCTPTDRNNPGKPNCYCFNTDWTRNTARANTNACKGLQGPTAQTSATGGSGGSGRAVCMDKNSGVDATCSCRSKGTCLTTGKGLVSGLTAEQFKMLSTPITSANTAYSGGIAGTSADMANLDNTAARLRKAANNALKKNPALKAAVEKKSKTMSDRLIASTKGMTPVGPSASSGAAALSNPQQALNELKKDIEQSKADSAAAQNSSGSFAIPDAPQSGEQQLEFGLSEQDALAQEKEISQVMGKDYNLNDINKSQSDNLFDVLSNRYKRSGMRRLFDDEGKTKADKPAETDINR